MLGSMYYFRKYKTYSLTISYDKIMYNIFKCSQDTKGFSKYAIFNFILIYIIREKNQKNTFNMAKITKIFVHQDIFMVVLCQEEASGTRHLCCHVNLFAAKEKQYRCLFLLG